MNKTKQILFHILVLCILCNAIYFAISWISPPVPMTAEASLPGGACTAFCLNNGDHCVFGPVWVSGLPAQPAKETPNSESAMTDLCIWRSTS